MPNIFFEFVKDQEERLFRFSEHISTLRYFLDAQASLAPTHVRPSVRHTFGFPICQRLWSPYVKS